MNFTHITSFFFRLHRNKIDASTTSEFISNIQHYECSNDDDDDDDDEYSSINANITFNNVKNALKKLYLSADDEYIRHCKTVEKIILISINYK